MDQGREMQTLYATVSSVCSPICLLSIPVLSQVWSHVFALK